MSRGEFAGTELSIRQLTGHCPPADATGLLHDGFRSVATLTRLSQESSKIVPSGRATFPLPNQTYTAILAEHSVSTFGLFASTNGFGDGGSNRDLLNPACLRAQDRAVVITAQVTALKSVPSPMVVQCRRAVNSVRSSTPPLSWAFVNSFCCTQLTLQSFWHGICASAACKNQLSGPRAA